MRIDPNAPTRDEIIAHNTRIAKCNLACNIAEKLAMNSGFAPQCTADGLASFAIAIAEKIIGHFPIVMPTSSDMPAQGPTLQ